MAGTIAADARRSFVDACAAVIALDGLKTPAYPRGARVPQAAADELCRAGGRAVVLALGCVHYDSGLSL